MANNCKHFRQRELIIGDGGCALGHPLRKMIKAKTNKAMADVFKSLCCKGNGKSIIDCPSADLKTDEEVEKDKEEMKAAIDRTVIALPKLSLIKSEMVAAGDNHKRANCAFCGAPMAMEVFVNIGGNKHMHCKCGSCGQGIME